jgi:hypothetical protein
MSEVGAGVGGGVIRRGEADVWDPPESSWDKVEI